MLFQHHISLLIKYIRGFDRQRAIGYFTLSRCLSINKIIIRELNESKIHKCYFILYLYIYYDRYH